MAKIAPDHYRKMRDSFRADVARYLARFATARKTITYGELSERFGGSPRGWGDRLGGIAIWCHEAGVPLLPVIVVNAKTRLPSPGAVLYEDLGMRTVEQLVAEQQRCFDFNWRARF